MGEAMGEAVLEEVEAYITRIQNTVAKYIATRMIMELCEELERWMGERVSKRCWEKEGIDLAGFQAEADTVAEYKEGMEMLETEN